MLVFVAELIERLDAVLQAPYVAEAGIGGGDDFGAHGVRRDGEVKAVVLAGHRHSVHAGLYHGFEVTLRAGGVFHAVAYVVGAFEVYSLGVVGDGGGANFAYDVEHAVIRIHGVVEVDGRVVEAVFVAEVAFFQFDNPLHQGVVQLEPEFRMVCIIVCHFS